METAALADFKNCTTSNREGAGTLGEGIGIPIDGTTEL